MAENGNEGRRKDGDACGVISFFIPMKKIPTTAQQKNIVVRGGKPKVIDSDKLREARSLLMGELWQRSPEIPMDGVLLLKTVWCFPIPKSEEQEMWVTVPVKVKEEENRSNHEIYGMKKKVPVWDGSWKGTRPDTDNLVKLLKDTMTECGYWYDDSQVAHEEISKVYSEETGLYIRVERLDYSIYGNNVPW